MVDSSFSFLAHFYMFSYSIFGQLIATSCYFNYLSVLDGTGWYWMVLDGAGNLSKPFVGCRGCLAGAFSLAKTNYPPGHF